MNARQLYAGTPAVVVCITDRPDERARLAASFDGDGVLVVAASIEAATAFLDRLQAQPPERADGDQILVGELRVDLLHHEARWRGQLLSLTPHELKVLGCLAGHAGRVWTYHQLHDAAWDQAYFTGPAAVQSVVKRLRAKLRQQGVQWQIEAARGVGFRLSARTDLHVVQPIEEAVRPAG